MIIIFSCLDCNYCGWHKVEGENIRWCQHSKGQKEIPRMQQLKVQSWCPLKAYDEEEKI